MRKLINRLSRLPIKWKLSIWSSLLLFCLFAAYNGIQYAVINNWFYLQEESRIQKVMSAVQGYYTETGSVLTADDVVKNQGFLQSLNEKNQMIRILNSDGQPLLTISNQVPTDWNFNTETAQGIVYTKHGDDHLLVIHSPLTTRYFTGTIEIVRLLENYDQLMNLIAIVMLIGGIGAVGISWLGGYFLSRKLIAPVKSITATMRSVRDKGLGERVNFSDNGDELSELAMIFNGMMERLERSFQQQRQFVEDASHELRTPLSIIEGHIGLLNRWGKHEPTVLDESLTAVSQEVDRLKTLVLELLELSRAERTLVVTRTHALASQPEPVIQQLGTNLKMLHPDLSLNLHLDTLTGVTLAINTHHLEQILIILLDNAIKYSSNEKRITIEGSVDTEYAAIVISDYGDGIAAEDLPYVLNRFYRSDKARSRESGGSGLGLSIAARLTEAYNGKILINSKLGIGTDVTLRLPIVQSENCQE